MLNTNVITNVITNSVSDTVAKIFGWNTTVDQSAKSVRKAMQKAAKSVAAENMVEIEGLFDQQFLTQHGASIVSDYSDGRLPRHQAAIYLASAWETLVVEPGVKVSKQRRADAVMAADRFLSYVEL